METEACEGSVPEVSFTLQKLQTCPRVIRAWITMRVWSKTTTIDGLVATNTLLLRRNAALFTGLGTANVPKYRADGCVLYKSPGCRSHTTAAGSGHDWT